LYFFHGQDVAILVHAIVKDTNQVPIVEIERAIARKCLFESDPARYTYSAEVENDGNE